MMFNGNYSEFAEKKKLIREAKLKEYLNQQQEIHHQEEVIRKLRSFNREKSIRRAESREKMLEKMDRIEKPLEHHAELKLHLEPTVVSGNDVLRVEGLGKSFGTHTLFQNINFEIKRGEHVAVIGDNGTGKTTLLKILNEVIPADHGTFTLGSNVHIGYYDQEHHVLHMEKTIFEEISDDYPSLTNTEIRNTLAAFLFTGEDVFKRIGDLSGGERGRVSLAKLMLSEANFLILDEPTNHLDIASKEILEQALNNYTGTVLYVSHDRYFINQTATRILDLVNQSFVNYIGNYDYYLEKKEELTAAYTESASHDRYFINQTATRILDLVNQSFVNYIGNYDYYLEKKEELTAAYTESAAQTDASSEETASESKLDWQAQKELQAKERKRQNDLKKLEEKIQKLEEASAKLDEELAKPEYAMNSKKLMDITNEKAEIDTKLWDLYEQWESLAE